MNKYRIKKSLLSQFMTLAACGTTSSISFKHHCLLCDEASPSRVCQHCQRFLVKPHYSCQQCAQPLKHFALFCGQCLRHPPAYDTVFSPFLYQAPLRSLIVDYKQKGHEYKGKALSQLFCESVFRHYQQQHIPLPTLITPVPLHWRAQWVRGFNQSAFFSRDLSQHLGIKYFDETRRIKWSVSQKELNRKERLLSLKNSFVATRTLKGESIVIVDDVMTTGATANTLAVELKKAGAGHISVWVLARTPNQSYK